MRTLVLCTFALAGLAALADDASAGPFRRNRDRGNDCCYQPAPPCCGTAGAAPTYGAYAMPHAAANPCCGTTVAGYSGMPSQYGSPSHYGSYGSTRAGATWWTGSDNRAMVDGQNVIRATDGSVYVRGADGSYYAQSQYGGQPYYTGQPYSSSYYGNYYGNYPTWNGRYGNYYSPSGVYQSGYPGYYYGPGVVPAGGTQPLTMPGVTLPGGIQISPGGITIPRPMPDR